MSKFFLSIVVVALSFLAGWNWYQRTEIEKQLSQVNPEQLKSTQDSVLAQEVVAKVKKHMTIDETIAPTIAKIADAEALRSKNPLFYKNAKNGDFVVITTTRAVLYSLENDVIIDVVPVQLQPTASQSSSSAKSSAKATSTK
jgi:hypothetical protein